MHILRKIDSWLLPRTLSEPYSPYIWLLYLPFYFVPIMLFYQEPIELLWAGLTVVTFLGLYFHSYWVRRQHFIFNIIGIVILGTMAAFVAPTANTLFVYAGAACGRIQPLKYAVAILISTLLWIVCISWLFDFNLYFYMPALIFTSIVGLIQIYQCALDKNKQALILSRKEIQRLAQVAERERIARDLHDLIGHTFSVITLKADLAGRLLGKDLDKARTEVQQIEDISRQALSQVREVVSGYRTSDLLSELANAKNVLGSLDIDFEYHFENIQEEQLELDNASNKELAIVLRELVTNIIKHAKASQVTATIKQLDGKILLAVQDNGQGFKTNQHQGFGIKGIEERMQKLKGFIKIKSGGEYSGTLSEICLPMSARD